MIHLNEIIDQYCTMRDSTENLPSIDVVRDGCIEARTVAHSDEMKAPKESILPFENPIRVGTAMKRTLVSAPSTLRWTVPLLGEWMKIEGWL